MENLSTEKDAPTVDNNPVWSPKREQNTHDPVGVDPFKGLGQVRQENAARHGCVVQELLDG